ncbi:rhodanese-like domain-containing protein [Blastopirellula retiformator]|uniref:Putative adenylyltransferase/sulfurtransferase MoeZ n=1 Tax=Blastopirellula retiformator TaxID=2527970 RepID=A0A5C5V610_9BACT|nr:rhodanese-like domain-containing protein [Blastopirellula retiformator]TWT33383.1 putative adenylyltransferase/sulfurtransferase MoeZ [Blastopirellula retiformator]
MSDAPIEISVHEVKNLLDSGDKFLLLDCRQENEYDFAKIEGAVLIPMNELPERIAELEPYRETPLVVHCHLGGRSLRVTHWLRQNGFAQAQNMTGGITQWSQEIDDSVPTY